MSATRPRITTSATVVLRPRRGRRIDFQDADAGLRSYVQADSPGRVEIVLASCTTWTAEAVAHVARCVHGAAHVVVSGSTSPQVLEAFRQALVVAGDRIRREDAREARDGSAQ